MSESKHTDTSTTYVGLVYYDGLNKNIPLHQFRVTQAEMENKHWLVELLVRLSPGIRNHAWHGARVLLISDKIVNLHDYSPLEPFKTKNILEFSSLDIRDAFYQHPIYNNKRHYVPD